LGGKKTKKLEKKKGKDYRTRQSKRRRREDNYHYKFSSFTGNIREVSFGC